MGRVLDRGALTAAYVGIGIAVVGAISFLLIIPIEPLYWILSIPAGLLIGWYANVRSGRRRGEWPRIVANAAFAGAATGLSLAALLLGVKALFFFGDGGYPDYNRVDPVTRLVIPPTCASGADCVYHRYVAQNGDALRAAGITDAASFGTLYWSEQWTTAGQLLAVTTGIAIVAGMSSSFAAAATPCA